MKKTHGDGCNIRHGRFDSIVTESNINMRVFRRLTAPSVKVKRLFNNNNHKVMRGAVKEGKIGS